MNEEIDFNIRSERDIQIEGQAIKAAISEAGQIIESIDADKPFSQWTAEDFSLLIQVAGRAYAREIIANYWLLINNGRRYEPGTDAPDAEFIGMQENPDGDDFELFNIAKPGHPAHNSTVTRATLLSLGLEPPECQIK